MAEDTQGHLVLPGTPNTPQAPPQGKLVLPGQDENAGHLLMPGQDVPPPAQPSTWDRIKSFVTGPLIQDTPPEMMLPILGARYLQAVATKSGHPTVAKVAGAYGTVEEALADEAKGASSPLNIGLMLASGGLEAVGPAGKAISRLASMGFSAEMLQGAYDHSQATRDAIQKGDTAAAPSPFTGRSNSTSSIS